MIKSKSNSGENTFVKIHHFTSMICIDIQKCSVTSSEAKALFCNTFSIIYVRISAVYFYHGPIVFMCTWFLNLPSPLSKCSNLEVDGPPVIQIAYTATILSALSYGIYNDMSLSHFLKKKSNAVGPGGSRLIPWKSGGEEYSILVPLSATIVSTLVSILCTFMIGLTVTMVVKWQFKIVTICGCVLISLVSIAILGLTLRVALKKKPTPVIPKGPMFHDEGENEESEIRTISASVQENQENQAIALPNQIT